MRDAFTGLYPAGGTFYVVRGFLYCIGTFFGVPGLFCSLRDFLLYTSHCDLELIFSKMKSMFSKYDSIKRIKRYCHGTFSCGRDFLYCTGTFFGVPGLFCSLRNFLLYTSHCDSNLIFYQMK